MNVLIACEFSGTVRDSFTRKGHIACSCDLLDSETEGWHYKGDIFDILDLGWDLLIAHPPCTYLTNSGVRWLTDNPQRWADLEEGAAFFRSLLECNIPKICIENPIPHKYATERIGQKYTQIIHPWQHGHGESKSTCLWLKGLPEIKPTNIVDGREQKVHLMPPGPNRWKERSRTYSGIAEAFAEQWS
jgi:hypothetical protein